MKRRVLLLFINFIFLLFSLSSCKPESEVYLDDIKKIYDYLDDAEIVYYQKRISGFDSSGVKYLVLDFPERPSDFISQFRDYKEFDYSGPGRNVDFERRTDDLINKFFKKEYEEMEEEYKINWEKKYYYFNNSPSYVIFPIIYFEDNYRMIIIESVY